MVGYSVAGDALPDADAQTEAPEKSGGLVRTMIMTKSSPRTTKAHAPIGEYNQSDARVGRVSTKRVTFARRSRLDHRTRCLQDYSM